MGKGESALGGGGGEGGGCFGAGYRAYVERLGCLGNGGECIRKELGALGGCIGKGEVKEEIELGSGECIVQKNA
jgi:hypothetical protein